MSWTEDNGIDGWGFDDGYERENEWKDGIHIDKESKEYKISEMTDSHLRNTIKYFEGLDTSPLKEELIKRIK